MEFSIYIHIYKVNRNSSRKVITVSDLAILDWVQNDRL